MLNLLDGLAGTLREEIMFADDEDVAQRLVLLLADVFECQDTIVGSL